MTSPSSSLLLKKLYFNPILKVYNLCYETCKTCSTSGNPVNHNCLTCDEDHLFIPDKNPKNNCITQCKYYYYFTYYGQYKCTEYPQCPEEAKFLIKDKNKCLDDCIKDNDYKYEYNGICVKECPENTINENYICKLKIDEDICILNQNILPNIDFENNNNVEKIVKSYIEDFKDKINIISQYQNIHYNMLVLKKASNCISELSLKISNIDFGECYNKIKTDYNIEEENLILAIIENFKKLNNNKPTSTFWLFDTISGQQIDIEVMCINETIIINQNIAFLLNETDNFEKKIELINQNINIFDPKMIFIQIYVFILFHQ